MSGFFFFSVALASSLLLPHFIGKCFANLVLLHHHIHVQHGGLPESRHLCHAHPVSEQSTITSCISRKNKSCTGTTSGSPGGAWFTSPSPIKHQFPHLQQINLQICFACAQQLLRISQGTTEILKRKHIPFYLAKGCVHQCTS